MKSHNTLLEKILLLFISIFIPLTLISIITIRHTNQRLQDQVISSIDSNNSIYISQLDSSLENIYINASNLLNQSNLKNFSNLYGNLSPYIKKTEIQLIEEQLRGIKTSSSFIKVAQVYFLDQKLALHPGKTIYGNYHTISDEEMDTLSEALKKPKSLRYYEDPVSKEWLLDYIISASHSDSYCAIVSLSQYELKKYLEANSVYDNEGFLLYSDTSFVLEELSDTAAKDTSGLQSLADTKTDTFFQTTLGGVDYYAFSYEIPTLSAQYIRLIPTDSLLQNIHTAPALTVLFLLFIFGACILFFIGVYRLIHKPLYQFTTAFEELEKGNFSVTIEDMHNPDFAYLFRAFNNMTSKLSRLIEQDYNQKMLLQKAELKQLQAQINPHFLYNSFFMLQRMIKMGLSEESQEMASALGKYFRYLTRNSMDNVTLETEYEHAKTYAYIQGLRFAGRIQIEFEDLPAGFQHLPVPKLILQPLLENAFNYGLTNKMENGLLKVHFLHSEDSLTIIVEDNGEELTDELLQSLEEKLNTAKDTSTDYEMTGLLNIQRRLAIFSDYTYSLNISRSDMGGLCVSICLRD